MLSLGLSLVLSPTFLLDITSAFLCSRLSFSTALFISPFVAGVSLTSWRPISLASSLNSFDRPLVMWCFWGRHLLQMITTFGRTAVIYGLVVGLARHLDVIKCHKAWPGSGKLDFFTLLSLKRQSFSSQLMNRLQYSII